jgi:Flp pilus assembly pilin Flp
VRKDLGQATVEYILIFAFMSLVSVAMVRSIGTGLSTSVRSLGWVLTQELSTGVCASRCFYTGYKNKVDD